MASFVTSKPKHIAIIMDGNRRWAKQQSKTPIYGHRAGIKTIHNVVKESCRQGTKSLSLFALSSENWSRPSREIRQLLSLFEEVLDKETSALHKQSVRLLFIGNRSGFPKSLINKIEDAERLTGNNQTLTLNIALNYGGRWDIVRACKKIALEVQNGKLLPQQVSEKEMAAHLCLAEQPAIDLCIRTGDEKRISNFFLWQMAYTEFFFSEKLWPDFNVRHFRYALRSFARRDRRFGVSKH